MTVCTPTCRRWTLFGFAVSFLVLGLLLCVFSGAIIRAFKDAELNLGSDGTTEYKMWEVTPIPMYIEFYLFNWTNVDEVINSKWEIKPNFIEMGPYTFHEKHYRKRVVFNDNHTVTYQTQRVWHFAPDKTKGSLDDLITTINPILATAAYYARNKHSIVRMAINFLMEEKRVNLTVTKKAREFIFDGYDDPLLDLLRKLHLRHVSIPFKKFAWFAERNGSITYDGTYNMYDGTDDLKKLGRFTAWNYASTTPYYEGYCGQVNGTSGELWYPVEDDDTIEIFSPDICSSLTLERNGSEEMFGITGHSFVSSEKLFDNGTKYPEMACFSPGNAVPSGVRNVSECKFGAPAFVSFPHFYLADPSYREAIDGMHPNSSEHKILVSIEPETGIPMQARVAAQINLFIDKIERITILKYVKPTFIPCMWFKQYATLDQSLARQAKLLLILPKVSSYVGYSLLGVACLLLFGFFYLMWREYRKGRPEETLLDEEES